ncbi:hypothetical protein OV090_19630 [Nannocystis sp. RBIL2]|uniref:hypothetical protein n=1 Tax=Nannocystis sp. RBIL2 TaxID=2996788 RepID=UPI00226E1F41|nr:hypothetical protein [Nannocystis sp. RBIL2]MCY1066992.1 hypothetical protein [Nannocystis sp. RBIL2]
MSRRPLLALAFALGALGGCFLTPNPPPSFRYNCSADSDCRVLSCRGDLVLIPDAEAAGMVLAEDCDEVPEADKSKYYEARQACLDGLCEYPCELSTDVCPAEKGYNLCFNGTCATACGFDDERFPDPDATCSSPQRCVLYGDDIELALIEDLLGGSGSGSGSGFPGGGGGGSSSVEDLIGTGVCGIRCDAEDARACPPGQYCSGAMCLPDCAHDGATPCADTAECYAFGGFSTCIAKCDPLGENTCEKGEVCVKGLGLCLPTCLGEDLTTCRDGFTCNEDLAICVPEDLPTTDGVDTDVSDTEAPTSETETSG